MTFTTFVRSELNNQILFKNSVPIQYTKTLLSFKDNSSGSFTKKEIRWSFNKDYWSAWVSLNQGNLTSISLNNNFNLYFEVRYEKINVASIVTSFSIEYIKLSASEIQTIINSAVPPITIVTPTICAIDTNNCEKPVGVGINAAYLNSKPGEYYLNRQNHIGEQPISSITDLQNVLNNFTQSTNNIINYIDGSLYIIDLSINELYLNNNIQDVSISYLSSLVGDNFINATLYDNSIGEIELFNRPVLSLTVGYNVVRGNNIEAGQIHITNKYGTNQLEYCESIGRIESLGVTIDINNVNNNIVFDWITNDTNLDAYLKIRVINYILNDILFNISINKTGNGTIIPNVGTYPLPLGSEVTITATETDPNYYLDSIYDNVTPVSNPYVFNIASNKAIEARFLAWQKIMDVFGTVPTLVGNNWTYEGGTNDVVVKNNQFLTCDGAQVGIYSTKLKLVGGKPIDITWYVDQKSLNTTQSFLYCGGSPATLKGITFKYISSNRYYVYTSNGSTQVIASKLSVSQYYIQGINQVRLQWDGKTGGLMTIKINDIVILTSNTTIEWDGDSIGTSNFISGFSNDFFNGYIYRIVNNSYKCKFDIMTCNQQGNILFDSSRYNNHLIVLNNNNYDVWQNKSNINEPFQLTNGFCVLKNSLMTSIIRPFKLNSVFDISIVEELWTGAIEYDIYDDGSGDYTTIRAALVALSGTFSGRIKLNVHAGTYNEQDLPGNNYIWLCAVGEVIIYSNGNSTDISPSDYSFSAYANTAYNLIPQDFKHNMYIEKDMFVTGLQFIATNVKYNIHQDSNTDYKCTFYGCSFLLQNNGYYVNNIGLGLRGSQYIQFVDCNFDIENSDTVENAARIFYHDSANQTKTSTLTLINCVAVNDNILYIQQESNVNNIIHSVHVENCTVPPNKGVHWYAVNSAYNYIINLAVINTILTHTQVNRPNYADYISDYYICPHEELLNTYTIPVNAELQDAGLPSGDYEYAELDALVQTDYLMITKTSNNISKLVVRKKQ